MEDTIKCKDYRNKEIAFTKFKAHGIIEWLEIVCISKYTSEMVEQIQVALAAQGFLDGYISDQIDDTIKRAIIEFQIANKLDLGTLSMQTLERLNIRN